MIVVDEFPLDTITEIRLSSAAKLTSSDAHEEGSEKVVWYW